MLSNKDALSKLINLASQNETTVLVPGIEFVSLALSNAPLSVFADYKTMTVCWIILLPLHLFQFLLFSEHDN